jgi:hypothetical protein
MKKHYQKTKKQRKIKRKIKKDNISCWLCWEKGNLISIRIERQKEEKIIEKKRE